MAPPEVMLQHLLGLKSPNLVFPTYPYGVQCMTPLLDKVCGSYCTLVLSYCMHSRSCTKKLQVLQLLCHTHALALFCVQEEVPVGTRKGPK